MKFGEKLRTLRTNREWTQPEAAELIGIEQSYMSKLENDNSIPSGEIFQQILDVFETTIEEIVDDLDSRSLNQLRQIPDLSNYLAQKRRTLMARRKRRVLGAVTFIALGASLIYAGLNHLFLSNMVHAYQSEGVVLEGESKEVFRARGRLLSPAATTEEVAEYIEGINARYDERFLLHDNYRGQSYNVPVEGGSRTYNLKTSRKVDPWQNKLITFLGIFLATFGIVGLLVEQKLSRVDNG